MATQQPHPRPLLAIGVAMLIAAGITSVLFAVLTLAHVWATR